MKKIIPSAILAIALIAFAPSLIRAAASFFVGDNGFVSIRNSDPQAPLDVTGAVYSRLVTATSSTIDWNQGNVQSTTLSSSPTFTFTNAQAGGEYRLILNQDGTGGRTVTWPANVKWPGGTEPTLTSEAGGTDVISFTYDGSRFLGSSLLSFSSSTLTESLIGYWKLDESSGNASDASGNGATLTNTNGVSYTSAKINNGGDFGSANTDKVLTRSAALGAKFDEPFTYNMWINVTTQPANNTAMTPFQWSDDTTANKKGYNQIQVYNNSGTYEVYIAHNQDGTFNQNGTAYTFTPATWYMLTYTWDGSTEKLYVNGNPSPIISHAATLTGSNTASGQGTQFQIGADTVNNRYFSGLVDEFGMWDRPLSVGEISALYASGNGKSYPF